MKTVSIEPHFQAWRDAARVLLAEKIAPQEVLWETRGAEDEVLFHFDDLASLNQNTPPLKVSKEFIKLAQTVSCHRSGQQWTMLYEIIHAMTLGGDRAVMQNQTNNTVRGLDRMRATISRDIHKMRAFVRFREVDSLRENRENFVAWFEPEHRIVRINTPFFRKRFGGMDWSILTPDECVHWDGEKIHFSEGVTQAQAPEGDELEELWRGYYRSIFNPARLKIKMMQSEMPKKYWKNLPEADIIEELIQGSSGRVTEMMDKKDRPLKPAPNNNYLRHLENLNRKEEEN